MSVLSAEKTCRRAWSLRLAAERHFLSRVLWIARGQTEILLSFVTSKPGKSLNIMSFHVTPSHLGQFPGGKKSSCIRNFACSLNRPRRDRVAPVIWDIKSQKNLKYNVFSCHTQSFGSIPRRQKVFVHQKFCLFFGLPAAGPRCSCHLGHQIPEKS